MTRLDMRLLALPIGMALVSTPWNARAQGSMATLRGRVSDEQGGSLEGASITARSTATNASRTTVSGNSGQYFIPNLPVGTYEVRASLPGFSEARMAQLVLQVGQEATVDLTLKMGAITEELLVTGVQPLLETTRNTIGAIIDKDQIDSLPVIDRDFASLALLVPGVTFGTGGNGPSLSINGQRGFANGYYVDGATAEWQHFGKQSATFVQDWIQEFQVMTNSYPAEFGAASGGIINAITRSGTNEFHGRLYGFFRDDALDAAPFAGTFDAHGKPEYLDAPPALSQSRLGGFFAGPILKDRLFFFMGYERFDRDSTAVLSISDYWRQRGVKGVLPVTAHDDPFMLKIDADFEGRNHVSVRFDRTNRIDTNQPQLSLLETEETRHRFGGPIWNLVGSWTTTISNSQFNELRAVYGSNEPPVVCNKSGTGGEGNLDLGPPGTFSRQEYPGAIFGCPVFSGLQGETTHQIADTFSWAAGRHQLKVGAQAYRVRLIMDIANFHDGSWLFASDREFDIDDPASYPLMLLANTGPTTDVDAARWNAYAFVQDTWQVTDKLTVNIGLRYDYDTSVQTGNEYVDAKNAQILARHGGTPLLEKTRADADNLAPRLGVVWAPGSSRRTVVRLGVGRFYDQNHNNFNAIAYANTLRSNGALAFNAANPLSWAPFGSPQALRLFLARNFPYFPDPSLVPATTEFIDRNDPGLEVAYTDQYTIGASHELGHGVSVKADYVLSRGWGAPAYIDENVAVSDGIYYRPDSRFGRIGTLFNIGKATYNALLAQVRYRGGRGALHAAYTLSKTTSNSSSSIFGGFGGAGPTNPFDISEDQGFDDADRRHNLALDGNVAFPWGFELSGVFVYRSAPPWSVTTRQQLDADPFPDRPEPRNSRRGDAFSTLDLRVGKTFRLSGRMRAAVYWEVYNLFNTDNFSGYVGVLQSPLFGLPTGAAEKRRQQGGFRIDF